MCTKPVYPKISSCECIPSSVTNREHESRNKYAIYTNSLFFQTILMNFTNESNICLKRQDYEGRKKMSKTIYGAGN